MKKASPAPILAVLASVGITAAVGFFRQELPQWVMNPVTNMAAWLPIQVPTLLWKELLIVLVISWVMATVLFEVAWLYLSIISAKWKQKLANAATGKLKIADADETELLTKLYKETKRP